MIKHLPAFSVCSLLALTSLACGKAAPATSTAPVGASGAGAASPAATMSTPAGGTAATAQNTPVGAGASGSANATASAGKAGASTTSPAANGGAGGASAAGGGEAQAGASAAGMSGGEAGAAAPSTASGDPDPSPGCMGGSLMPGESMQKLESGGASRVYVQHVPKSYDGKKPLPLVLDLHGGSYDGPRWVNVTGTKELSETEGFIVLYPSGTENSWQATKPDSSDGQFLRELIAETGKKGCIDRKRVYSTGCSMGGAMSFWMGCFASDLIAAIAPDCGTPFFKLAECQPKRPLSVMLTIGETDNLNCWEGMPGSVGNPCAKEVQSAFKGIDMCMGDFKKTHDGVCETYDQCAQGTEVTICKSNTGHGVYVATNLKVTEEGWKFLKRFSMP